MIDLIRLYRAVKQTVPSGLSTKFNFVETAKIESGKFKPTKDTVAIYFKTANNGVRTADGKYAIEFVRMIVNVYTSEGERGVLDGHTLCKQLCESFDCLFNTDFEIDGVEISILDCKREGLYNYTGPHKSGVETFSINYLLTIEGGLDNGNK